MSVHDDVDEGAAVAPEESAQPAKKLWSTPVCDEVKLAEATQAMGAGSADEAILS